MIWGLGDNNGHFKKIEYTLVKNQSDRMDCCFSYNYDLQCKCTFCSALRQKGDPLYFGKEVLLVTDTELYDNKKSEI